MRTVALHGLRVASTLPLPGAVDVAGAPDVDVHLGRPPGAEAWGDTPAARRYESEREPGQPPSLVVDEVGADGLLRLRYEEGIEFHVSRTGDAVWCAWRSPLTAADAVSFLTGPVMGTVLRRRGIVALHASAVVIDGGAYAFIGPGGSGKSTLAAAFAVRGRAMLTEDVLALVPRGDGWMVPPAYPGIRLWDEGAALVAGGEALPEITPNWPKREFDLAARGLPFARDAVPLRGLFVLDDYLDPGAPPRSVALAPGALLVELVANVYANYAASGPELARELGVLRAVAEVVPGWRFAPASGVTGLSESCSAIESLVNRR